MELTRDWLLDSIAKDNGFCRQKMIADGNCLMYALLSWYKLKNKTFPSCIQVSSSVPPHDQLRSKLCKEMKNFAEKKDIQELLLLDRPPPPESPVTKKNIFKALKALSLSGKYAASSDIEDMILGPPLLKIAATFFGVQIQISQVNFHDFPDPLIWQSFDPAHFLILPHGIPPEVAKGLPVIHLLRVYCTANDFFCQEFKIADHFDLLFPEGS